jgi:hypothetical protein
MKKFSGLTLAVLILLSLLLSCSSDRNDLVIGPLTPRQGEAVLFELPDDLEATWSVVPTEAGLITEEGRFVGYRPGPAVILAQTAERTDALAITITPRGAPQGEFAIKGRGLVNSRYTSDLWVADGFGYTGTWLGRGLEERLPGDRLLAWDLTDPVLPRLTAEIVVDARTVNDVKIRADNTLAVLTHEGSSVFEPCDQGGGFSGR